MLRVWLGRIAPLSQVALPPGLARLAPHGPRRAAWIAGRVLLSYALSPTPIPDIVHRRNGKPAFASAMAPWFNLSHSGDDIALAISDEGEVGCDIEVIRPRPNWRRLAEAAFSAAERQQLAAKPEKEQLSLFWQIWTRKEAILKQAAYPVWQMAEVDSVAPHHTVCQRLVDDRLWLAVCAETMRDCQVQRVALRSELNTPESPQSS